MRKDVLHSTETKIKFAVSYADAFAVVLEQSLAATILTGAVEMINLCLGAKVEKLKRD